MQQRVEFDEGTPVVTAASGLLADEDAVSPMLGWMAEGQRAVLVTMVGVHGGAPRAPGAQMAVSEDGRFAGYLSGGCLEQAVVLEALDVLKKGQNRLVRYGKDSPYFDIRLPCGSGLDVYFDQALTHDDVATLALHRAQRASALLRTDLSTGKSSVVTFAAGAPLYESRRTADVFERVYTPPLQLLLVGTGPGLLGLASLASAIGITLRVVPFDDATRANLSSSGHGAAIETRLPEALDFASAAVLVLHDHDKEPDVLEALLRTDCFYVGALGNHAVHRARLAELAARGLREADRGRIRAPVGAIPGAKSKATLAVGVLMELMAEAKARNLVS
ncbi:MAG TPA: XdhC family protein [Hyphomicrobium sp.]|nr:XdhC family protein [Hyphomicrobium sp.]